MQKFTKIMKEDSKSNEPELKYDGYLKIKAVKQEDYDYEFVVEDDVVVIIPYFEDDGFILLRHEPIMTYQYRYKDSKEFKNVTHFLTVVSGTVEKGETLINTVRRELYEETGVVLSDLYQFKIDKDLFMSKGNSAKYYTCFLKIGRNDYRVTTPPSDGSVNEKNSKTLQISISDLESIKAHDLITEYMITKFKSEYLNNND